MARGSACCGRGWRKLLAADAPPHGGFRGYVADPDDHAREMAWNPSWPIAADGPGDFPDLTVGSAIQSVAGRAERPTGLPAVAYGVKIT